MADQPHAPTTISPTSLVANLRAEHASMLTELDRLSRALLCAPKQDYPAARAALEDWLGRVLVPHADSEQDVYALVAAADPGGALSESIRTEHRNLCEAVGRFSEVWQAAAARTWARSLYEAFDAHQHKEEELLFTRLLAA
ncbi:hemerythrin domain-containing protein [Raineyella antarctica]|nr:hemerythrin domain-containing protein [Raineyella antarctica]